MEFTSDQVQGVFGEFKPALDEAAAVVAATFPGYIGGGFF